MVLTFNLYNGNNHSYYALHLQFVELILLILLWQLLCVLSKWRNYISMVVHVLSFSVKAAKWQERWKGTVKGVDRWSIDHMWLSLLHLLDELTFECGHMDACMLTFILFVPQFEDKAQCKITSHWITGWLEKKEKKGYSFHSIGTLNTCLALGIPPNPITSHSVPTLICWRVCLIICVFSFSKLFQMLHFYFHYIF